jgi:hypothetical protein
VSKWSRKVAAALRKPEVRAGIAQLFAANMKKHIDENYGRGRDGSAEGHRPLKNLFGTYWASSAPKYGIVVGTKKVQGKGKRKKTLKEIQVPSYRNGEQPLRNTSKMYNSLNAAGARTSSGIAVTLRGLKYALYQDKGFKTSEPNYIPLSKKGARNHATGANPMTEGLKRGRDFFIARRGVTVPSRPFLLPTRAEMKDIGASIFMSLQSILKGN